MKKIIVALWAAAACGVLSAEELSANGVEVNGFACASATEADAADAMKTMHSMKFFMPLFYHNRVRDAIIVSPPNRVVPPSAEFCLNIRV